MEQEFNHCVLSYQAPEVIEMFMRKRQGKSKSADSKYIDESCLHGIDVWSLGITLLEIVIGFPVWI